MKFTWILFSFVWEHERRRKREEVKVERKKKQNFSFFFSCLSKSERVSIEEREREKRKKNLDQRQTTKLHEKCLALKKSCESVTTYSENNRYQITESRRFLPMSIILRLFLHLKIDLFVFSVALSLFSPFFSVNQNWRETSRKIEMFYQSEDIRSKQKETS